MSIFLSPQNHVVVCFKEEQQKYQKIWRFWAALATWNGSFDKC